MNTASLDLNKMGRVAVTAGRDPRFPQTRWGTHEPSRTRVKATTPNPTTPTGGEVKLRPGRGEGHETSEQT